MQAQREKMFLYYTMRWVKMRVSCVFLAFFSHFAHVFAHKACLNTNPMHGVIWALVLGYNKPNHKKNHNYITYSEVVV